MEDNVFRCPQCASPTEQIREGRVSGVRCPRCGWSVVTTETDAIDRDVATYEVRIENSDFHDKAQVKIVSHMLGINFLQATRLLQEDKPLVYRGNAREVQRIKSELETNHISLSVTPPFHW